MTGKGLRIPLVAALVVALSALSGADTLAADRGGQAGDAGSARGSFEVVGHSPLLNRGMNSALAVHGDYVYVGSRTDGTHKNAGVLVVDKSDPSDLRVVGQIGRPNEANPGETSRELRVWPERPAHGHELRL